jgi:toxin FitB
VSWLIDTNIISEVRKGRRCDPRVAAWYATADAAELYLSVLVLGEIRKGVDLVRPRDPDRAAALESWLAAVDAAFAGRILPVDREVADAWGRLAAPRTIPVIDALLAATAAVHRLTLVTRNHQHVAGLGVEVLNPFEA